MDYIQLRAFHAVACEGGFTRAAERMHVTQPTLSAQVKSLEERYGVALFDRLGRGVALTALGRQLLELTRRLFLMEEEAQELLARAHDLSTGQLRVSADGPYHALPLLAAFAARYPAVHISLAIGNSGEVVDALKHYRADVAVVADIEADDRIEAVLCAESRLVIFVPRGHPWAARREMRLAELEAEPMILRERGSMTRELFERATRKAKVQPRVVMEIESREAVREAVAAGLGVGVVSEAEFGHDERLVAIPVAGGILVTREYAAWLRERRNLRIVAAFAAVVRAALKRDRSRSA